MKVTVLFVLLLIFPLPRTAACQNVLTSIHFQYGAHPGDDFARQVKNSGLGVDAAFVIPLGEDTPFWAGLEMGTLFYGTKARSVELEQNRIRLEPIKGVVLAHLLWRTQWHYPKVRPYFDLAVGLQHFFSESSAQQGPIYGILQEGQTYSTTEVERSFSAGAAAGVMIRLLNPSRSDPERRIQEILIDIRARFLRGGEITFFEELPPDGDVTQNFKRVDARTDIFLFQIGVSALF
jgi:hypothetical protein